MKYFINFSLIFLTSLYISACAKTNGNNIHSLLNSSNRIILETNSFHYDSMGSPNGRVLEFRLYENGKFEYEEISEEKLKSLDFQSFYHEAVVERQGVLSDEEITKVTDLISNPKFQKINSYYKNVRGYCTCGASRFEISYRTNQNLIKHIIIDGSGCADLTNPNADIFPNFPKQLSDLIKQIYDARSHQM